MSTIPRCACGLTRREDRDVGCICNLCNYVIAYCFGDKVSDITAEASEVMNWRLSEMERLSQITDIAERDKELILFREQLAKKEIVLSEARESNRRKGIQLP